MNDAILVFDYHSKDDILRLGASQAWKLNKENAVKCHYLVCARNSHKDARTRTSEPHRAAFLVGKISDIKAAAERDRYEIHFDEYASVSIPDVWRPSDRNPVRYVEIADLGIDPSRLDWEALTRTTPPQSAQVGEKSDQAPPLTIREAKERLALTFGVSPDAIEIHIRG